MYIGRLAPSPTGLLHLGHARTFWIAHERARERGGKLWLRDEDLDPHRSLAKFSQAMREDLRWLGIAWDEELTQSHRLDAYRDAAKKLLRMGLIYPCTCSRKDLAQSIRAPHEDTDDEPVYDGRCRGAILKSEDDLELAANTNYRLMVPDGEAIKFVDELAGPQSFVAGEDFGDFVVWRKDGLPSYQLACVVDDAAMQITEVVRGRDLLKSTARQMHLQRELGLATPAYYHCELMRDEAGVRLAKRHDALALRALREQGRTPEEVRALMQL